MNIDLDKLGMLDRVSLILSGLYESCGYRKFKMSQLEEYDFYLDNKSFLSSDKIITFSDTAGRLLALKPDVTLSIVKNTQAGEGVTERIYYNENVFRFSKHTKSFKEIGQIGLEFLGDLDDFASAEVLALAIESLKAVDEDYILDISHTAFLSEIFSQVLKKEELSAAYGFVRAKNLHDLTAYLEAKGASAECIEAANFVLSLRGDPLEAVEKAVRALNGGKNKAIKAAAESLSNSLLAIKAKGLLKNVRVDFSIVNDMDYYEGIIFHGYVKKVPSAVLTGGRYDNLLKKFGRDAGAMGFALYMDELGGYYNPKSNDIDVVIVYNKKSDAIKTAEVADGLRAQGLKVWVGKTLPKNVRYGTAYVLENGGLKEVKNA